MNSKNNIETLKNKLGIELNEAKIEKLKNYGKLFLSKNAHTNLISKNDEKFLFEKHIFDSLAINLFFKKYAIKTEAKLLDIGTGGGFPSVPLSIVYENLAVYPLDSIAKKIKLIQELKEELNLKNIFPTCDRAENVKEKFDYITTRAVAPIDKLLKYAIPLLKEDGFFIAYKSRKISEELEEAQKTIKYLKVKVVDAIEYTLPLDEIYERNLIIFKKS